MRTLAFSAFVLGLALTSVQLTACSNSADDCNATATCSSAGASASGSAGKSGGGSGNDGGNGAGGSQSTSGSNGSGNGGQAGGPGSDCDGDVGDDPMCWTTNDLGVFVSSDAGDDATGDGSKEAPFASISKGIAGAAGKNVYVCLGTADYYEEKLSITSSVGDGARVYGGFECTGWTHSKTRYVGVASTEPTGLRIDGLKQGVVLENLRIEAADGAGANASSFGALITNSKNVVLRRVQILAGEGLKGAAGEPGTVGSNGESAGQAPGGSAGCAVTAINGEWSVTHDCGDGGESQGGPGGKGAKNTANAPAGQAGSPTQNVHPLGSIDNGGPGEGAVAQSLDGKPGTTGDAGALGALAPVAGIFSDNGFAVADGAPGTAGYPGQGGGGGGASKGTAACFGASGGAGGMAGCGGGRGLGGRGGGASVGLLSWNSEVAIDASVITAGTGGGGGEGGPGGGAGVGAEGGAAGVASPAGGVLKAGRGGVGGDGGNGGSGSGGSGGPSYALAYFGTKPVYTAPDTTLMSGDGGEPGLGGQLLEAKAPNGSTGESLLEFQVP